MVVAAIVIVLDEVPQRVDLDAISILDMNFISISPHYFTISLGLDQVATILSHCLLNAGTDNRWLWREQRHCLALHVRASQGTVNTGFLNKRHQRRRRAEDLLVSSVHKGNFFDIDLAWLEEFAGADAAVGERLVII